MNRLSRERTNNYHEQLKMEALLEQKDANDILLNILRSRIEVLNNEIENEKDLYRKVLDFFEERKSLIPEFVEFIYKNREKEQARIDVAYFDEAGIIDLSELKCTGDDF